MTQPEPTPNTLNGYASDFPFAESDRERLSAALSPAPAFFANRRQELIELARGRPEINVLTPFGFPIDELLHLLPNLRWLALSSAGAEHALSQPWASGPNAPLITTASGVHSAPISEHIFSAMLLWSRHWPDMLRLQSVRSWPDFSGRNALAGRELDGATLLVIGLGAIGRRVAQLGRAFGMRVIGVRHSTTPDATDPDTNQLGGMVDLDTLLPAADYVVIATPSTPETRGMFSAARLALMKPTAMLVNIARGEIVDEPALIAALTSGKLGAAALDVTAREPLPSDDPLWTTPNVFISPHISGLTPRYSARLTDILLDNFTRYRAGAPLRNLVQPERGY